MAVEANIESQSGGEANIAGGNIINIEFQNRVDDGLANVQRLLNTLLDGQADLRQMVAILVRNDERMQRQLDKHEDDLKAHAAEIAALKRKKYGL